MVTSSDRRRGGQQQCDSLPEEEEVMVLRHLYSLPQTVTMSNRSDRGTRRVGQRQMWHGGRRGWSPFKTPSVGEHDQKLPEMELTAFFVALNVGMLQDVQQDLSCKPTSSFNMYPS